MQFQRHLVCLQRRFQNVAICFPRNLVSRTSFPLLFFYFPTSLFFPNTLFSFFFSFFLFIRLFALLFPLALSPSSHSPLTPPHYRLATTTLTPSPPSSSHHPHAAALPNPIDRRTPLHSRLPSHFLKPSICQPPLQPSLATTHHTTKNTAAIVDLHTHSQLRL